MPQRIAKRAKIKPDGKLEFRQEDGQFIPKLLRPKPVVTPQVTGQVTAQLLQFFELPRKADEIQMTPTCRGVALVKPGDTLL